MQLRRRLCPTLCVRKNLIGIAPKFETVMSMRAMAILRQLPNSISVRILRCPDTSSAKVGFD